MPSNHFYLSRAFQTHLLLTISAVPMLIRATCSSHLTGLLMSLLNAMLAPLFFMFQPEECS